MRKSTLHLLMENRHLNDVQYEMTQNLPIGREAYKAEPLSSSCTPLCSGEPSTADSTQITFMSSGQRGRITSLDLLATLLMQPRVVFISDNVDHYLEKISH